MKSKLLALCLLTLALFAIPAISRAQVRNPPAGNSLPEPATPPAGETLASSLAPTTQSDQMPPIMDHETHERFAERLDFSKFRKLAVFDAGRAKILDTMAREFLVRVYGKERWKDNDTGVTYDPLFTLLDVTFNKPYYFDKPMIYVEVLPLRRELVKNMSAADQEKYLHIGRLTPDMVASKDTMMILASLDGNLINTKGIGEMHMAVDTFAAPEAGFFFISPDPAADHWASLLSMTPDGKEMLPPNDKDKTPVSVDPAKMKQTIETFQRLQAAWIAADAVGVNKALDELSDQFPNLNAASYPSPWVRESEAIYNATHKFTIGYVGYLFGMIVFLIAFGAQRKWLVRLGVALLFTGIAIHLAGFIVRMILAGRWAIHNQYESFIFITLASVIVGTIVMFARKQWLFGAAACAMGAVSLLVANTVDIPSREVGQVAGILATSRILYIHVNMVLVSYGLIALGFFVSLFYLIAHYGQGGFFKRFAAAGLGNFNEAGASNLGATNLGAPGAALAVSSPGVAMSAASADAPSSSSGGSTTSSSDSEEPVSTPTSILLRELDHAQMVIFQLAFYLLGTGILLGAYWADHAWGRWWAWDPKETWALITWIIYLMVIHVRFTVKDRGLATAWLGVIGFFMMLWCYWGVNMFLAGLHSYA